VAVISIIVIAAALSREPQLPAGVTCADIRSAVDTYGLPTAIWWARQKGYSWTQIFEAKKCLR
jgi:hypothetical protein